MDNTTAAIYVRRSAVDSANTEADAFSRSLAAQERECLAWAEHQRAHRLRSLPHSSTLKIRGNFKIMKKLTRAGEFTLSAYRDLLEAFLENRYTYGFFEDAENLMALRSPFVLLRHDVDLSLHKAHALAVVEQELGVKSTYFIRLRSSVYNPFDPEETAIVQDLLQMGHRVGLHFDTSIYGGRALPESLAGCCAKEIAQLEHWFEIKIEIVSFHQPSKECLRAGSSITGGVPHTYLPLYTEHIGYCSDSTGQWRFGHPLERDEFQGQKPLHLLVHPIWWGTESRSPQRTLQEFALDNSARVEAAIEAERHTVSNL